MVLEDAKGRNVGGRSGRTAPPQTSRRHCWNIDKQRSKVGAPTSSHRTSSHRSGFHGQIDSCLILFSYNTSIMATAAPLRVGFVPEHFSTPLHFAKKHFGLTATLVPFPSGTGHMITSLRAGEIDVGIGLTEGWVAGLGKADLEGDGGYRIVGTYVETPLCTPIPLGLLHVFEM